MDEKETRVERVTRYEALFDRIAHKTGDLSRMLGGLLEIVPDVESLAEYYEGKEWREDFEADGEGLLPRDLKRGVLSEDGVYNLLEEFESLRSRMALLASGGEETCVPGGERDMSVPCADGRINLRVGAVILKDGKFLMAGSRARPEYLYTVGGRIKFGETAEEAVVREVLEETGISLEVDRLGFVHENYFIGDAQTNRGKLIYELAFYYYMKVPKDFELISESFADGGQDGFLRWVSPEDPVLYYPGFFRTELAHPEKGVKFFQNDERPGNAGGIR